MYLHNLEYRVARRVGGSFIGTVGVLYSHDGRYWRAVRSVATVARKYRHYSSAYSAAKRLAHTLLRKARNSP